MFRFTGGWEKLEHYELVTDRFQVIRKHIDGKTVLDCGAGGVSIDPESEWWQNFFLHRKLTKYATKCVGIDNDREAVKALSDMGYDIRYGDIENINLNERFDVIVAGELIEHLSNPGLFLENVKEHLNPGGRLIVTTPNPWNLGCIVRALFGKKIMANETHVAWYDKLMLEQLLERHGFKVMEFFWYHRVIRGFYHLVRIRHDWALNIIIIAKPKETK